MLKMRKISLLSLLVLALGFVSQAQKFGYVDTEYILKKTPEYSDAQKEIDKISIKYQIEIEKKHKSLDSIKKVYQNEVILYTEEMKAKKQAEISSMESEVYEYQNKIFGYEGLIYLKRQELIAPIQDKIYAAIEVVAKKHKLQLIFDKAGSLTILYADATHDYTDFVLEELGFGDKGDKIDNPK
jgi:outer membrane protein